MVLARAIDSLVVFGREALERGLLASTCGNASIRVDDERMVITSSGAALGALSPDEVALVSIADGDVLSGHKPSMEMDMHRLAFLQRPDVGAVLHCQSRAATLLCCMAEPPANLDLIPEIPAYIRAHAYVPYAQPGSVELADHVGRALEDPDVTVVQMRNHGQVVIGATWEGVIRRAQFFELACWIAAQGRSLTTIPPADAAALRGYARDV